MRAQHQRARILGVEFFGHERRPQKARGAQLGDFHEEVHADGKEEREARRKFVDVEAAGDRGADVFDAVSDRVRKLLGTGRPGFLHETRCPH